MTLDFKQAGDVVILLGQINNDINSSEYLHKICGVQYSPAPHFELEEEFQLQQTVSSLIKQTVLQSAHDISEGGLFVTLCESGFTRNLGFILAVDASVRADAFLFGESQSRVVVSVKKEMVEIFTEAMKQSSTPFLIVGETTESNISVDNQDWGNIASWKKKYDEAIENILGKN